jgi:hypothetical protein
MTHIFGLLKYRFKSENDAARFGETSKEEKGYRDEKKNFPRPSAGA